MSANIKIDTARWFVRHAREYNRLARMARLAGCNPEPMRSLRDSAIRHARNLVEVVAA